MPIYNESFAGVWEKIERIEAAKKLLRRNGYTVKKQEDERTRRRISNAWVQGFALVQKVMD